MHQSKCILVNSRRFNRGNFKLARRAPESLTCRGGGGDGGEAVALVSGRIGPMLFKSDEMEERDDYRRFKDDPPIEGRLLGYLQFAARLLRLSFRRITVIRS